MARTFLTTMTVAACVLAWSPFLTADEFNAGSLEREIRDIKQLLTELNERVQRLDKRIAADGQTTKRPDAAAADLMWQVFGARVEEMKREEVPRTGREFRGGMKVVAVRPGGPAMQQGIQVGDVLVGIHVWETVNGENINFILASHAVRENKSVKVFFVRNGETLHVDLTPANADRH